ncbi:hypothetical protein Tco_0291292 [Tanacetum coccineum]
MPYVEHRQCARHIYEGFRKQYSGVEFRLLFWAVSKATYPGLFNKIMEKIKRANPNAYDYLLKKEPKIWSRAYFHIGTNCEAVKNGFSECFNSMILSVRSKPLITMLEAIRVIVLERMHIMRNLFWHVIPTGGNLFEVRNGSEAFGVDEERRNCTCRLWMVEDYVPDCYRKQAFYDTYHQYLTPIGGMTFWPDCSDMSRVLPPKPRTMPGRPRKKRIRAAHENKNPNKFDVGGEEQVTQFDMGVKTTVKRGGSAQFGVQRGENHYESDPVENSEMAQETNQNAANDSFTATQETHQFSATAFASTQNSQNHQVSEQEPQAAEQEPHRARPRGILNFIRPRPRSERILKKQLGKKVHGIGSTSSNALNLE